MQTTNLKSARAAILSSISSDIRRVGPGSGEVTADVALSNWEYYFGLCRFAEARRWWSYIHERIAQGRGN